MTPENLKKKLIKSIGYLKDYDIKKIDQAYEFARSAHSHQKRNSGEPYIIHPLNIAISLTNLLSDTDTIIAGLLHDTVEDTSVIYKDISDKFGSVVANLVDGVTKISQIKNKNKILKLNDFSEFSSQVDNYRKLLTAMAGDPRVIIIKLYDRLHNAQTLSWLSGEKRIFYALETIEIYSAIANRLGMGDIHGQLSDLCFPHAYHYEYKKFIQIIRPIQKIRKQNIDNIIGNIKNLLSPEDISVDIHGRIKRDYSLYKKLQLFDNDISKIYDLVAIRIIVDTISNCYKVLGIIHSAYKPIEGKISDYIARPKDNGYQSLHTVVQKDDSIFEVQIRTTEMHQNAEYGIAAHWKYKINEYDNNSNDKNELKWLREINQSISSGYKLTNGKKFFSSKIFVFSPNGKIFELPEGSTPVDFAFLVHTDIGLCCSGAKINKKLSPLNTILKTGDVIEILKNDKPKPSKDWINIVKTSQAKNKIKAYFSNIDKPKLIKKGLLMVNEEVAKFGLPQLIEANFNKYSLRLYESKLPFNNIESALVSISKRNLSAIDFLKVILENQNIGREDKVIKSKDNNKINLSIGSGIPYKIARCCNPKSSDPICGYITLQHKITIHKKSCAETKRFSVDRIIRASWQ